MKLRLAVVCVVAVALVGSASSRTAAQATSPLGGIWSLNKSLSEAPKEIGFDVVLPNVGDTPGQTAPPSGGRGRRGSSRTGGGAASPFAARPESYQDGQRMRILVGEVREPSTRLTIIDTPSVVTITNDLGQSRVYHLTGREESIDVENIPIAVTATRDGDKLIVLYHVEQNRDIRWTYTPSTSPKRISVEAQLIERGKDGDKATRVYDAGLTDVAAASSGSAPSSFAGSRQPVPPGAPAPESFDQRPNAEFVGLKSVGVLVEDLGPEARTCGLRQDAIEDAVAKRLTSGGLSVRKNSDEDTYVYVNIITTSLPSGTCVSRYDAFLYTHATSKLSYHERPVLVQVSLMHRGGIGASAAGPHGASVMRGLEGYVDVFVSQIRDANK